MTARVRDVENLLVGADNTATHLKPVSMADVGWQERADIQRWIRANPAFLGPNLLLIAEEFADWEGAGAPIRDRLDLLFLDEDGRLLVVELKRGLAPDRTESQALVYAAYCDQLTTDDVIDQHAKLRRIDREEARDCVLKHAQVLAEEPLGKVRVRIVAEEFPPSTTATIMFLRDLGAGGPESAKLDIGCIKLTAYELPDGSHVMSAQPLIPIPETEDYLVRRRKREAEAESTREARSRAVNATIALIRADAIDAGTPLRMNLDWLSDRERQTVATLLEDSPTWGEAVWSGEQNQARAIHVHWSDEPVSVNQHHQAMREAAGLGTQPGATNAWIVGDTGKSLRDLANELADDQDPGEGGVGTAE